jgi:hypothetical protein
MILTCAAVSEDLDGEILGGKGGEKIESSKNAAF